MNMFARFDENPAMTLRVIKETKHYGLTDGRTHGQHKTVYPPQTKFAGGIKISLGEVYRQIYGQKISFTAMRRRKALLPTVHPTIYLPK